MPMGGRAARCAFGRMPSEPSSSVEGGALWAGNALWLYRLQPIEPIPECAMTLACEPSKPRQALAHCNIYIYTYWHTYFALHACGVYS